MALRGRHTCWPEHFDSSPHGALSGEWRNAMPGYWWFFGVRHYRLRTRLSPQRCEKLLQEKLKPACSSPGTPFSIFVRGVVSEGIDIRGVVSAQGFSIRCGGGEIRNFWVRANGSFVAAPTGTQIEAHLSIDRPTFVFLLLWFGLAACFLAGGVSQFVEPQTQGQPPQWPFVLIPAGMLLFGYGLSLSFRRALEGPLLKLLKQTLHAEDASRL